MKESGNEMVGNNTTNVNNVTNVGNNGNYYIPNGQDDKGMSKAIFSEIASQNKKVNVYGNQFSFDFTEGYEFFSGETTGDIIINDKKTEITLNNKKKTKGSEHIELFFENNETAPVQVNDNFGFINADRITLGNDLSVEEVRVKPSECGITIKDSEGNIIDGNITIKNKVNYIYDENKNIIGHSNYESYSVSQLAGLTFNKIEIPNDASEKTKRQIQYRNQQFKKLCDFLNTSGIQHNVEGPAVEITFIDNDAYVVDLSGDETVVHKYNKKTRSGENDYQLQTTIPVNNQYASGVLLDQNGKKILIGKQEKQSNPNGHGANRLKGVNIKVLDMKQMKPIERSFEGKEDAKNFNKLNLYYLGKKTTRTTKKDGSVVEKEEDWIHERMKPEILDKKKKKYFDEQVKKEQGINQVQGVNNIGNQVNTSLENKKEKNKGNQK